MLLLVLSCGWRLQGATPEEEIQSQVPAARKILDKWQADSPVRAERFVHLVYWTPADREPAPRYRERLTRIFDDIRSFYGREMERNGFGPRTFELQKEADGLCKIHLVRGSRPYAEYEVQSGSQIREECLPELRAAGLNPEQETIVIFCNMSNWDAEKRTMSQNSPYYAGGTNRQGTAWQVDSPLLDLDLLTAREPMLQDGQYGRISPGRYNSIFIGGIAHELGHALGLPHDRERPDQAALWGTALMGSGNRTYGENLREEGKGTFLTLSEAMRLASHPLLCGSVKEIGRDANARITEVKFEPKIDRFTFSARVIADPPAYAVIGATDPAGGSDYDATTATAVPDKEGRFVLDCTALTRGKAAVLHVIVAQANGSMGSFIASVNEPCYPYRVEQDGTLDLSAAWAPEKLATVLAALKTGRQETAEEALRTLDKNAVEPLYLSVAKALVETLASRELSPPAETAGTRCDLTSAKVAESSVGYGSPTANRLPGDSPLLIAGSRLFARGLYAHAPARHVWSLGGKWSRLTGKAGLADGHDGSVVFSIHADGQELWHSPRVQAGTLVDFDVPVEQVQQVEMKVSDAGDGNRADWGLWLEPTLQR